MYTAVVRIAVIFAELVFLAEEFLHGRTRSLTLLRLLLQPGSFGSFAALKMVGSAP